MTWLLLPGRVLGRAAPWLCAALHLAALLVLALLLRGGTGAEPDPARRAAFVAEHRALWAAGWGVWMLAAVALVAFYSWWAGLVPAGRGAVLLAAAGMACDLAGEGVLVAEPSAHRLATLLTAGAANGLYTLGGVLLTLRTSGLPRAVRIAMGATWAAGAAMTASAILDSATGLVLSTAVLFPLFVAWTAWMARSWGRR